MIIRVTVVTLFLGSFLVFGINYKEGPLLIPTFYFIIATTFLFTLIYAILFKKTSLKTSAYLQIIGDILLITTLVSVTEGIDSPFVFLYLFSIIPASIMLYRPGALAAASMSSICYGAVVELQYHNLLPFLASPTMPTKTFFYVLTLHIVAFFAVAFLSSSAVETMRKMKEELREKDSDIVELQAFNENVAQCMSTGLFTTDEAGRITSFNRAAEEITGYRWEEVRGKKYTEILPVEKLKDILHNVKALLPIYRFESDVPRKDGSIITLGINVSHLVDETGQSRGIIGIFQDLTKIKEMEKEVKRREKMAMIGELAAGMAHEIRNPLASLSGSMQILRQELSLRDDHERLMKIALREMDRLNRTITDFLLYAKPMPLQKKAVNINELILDTIRLLKNHESFRNANILIQAELKERELILNVDPNQISQVFWNLSLNALYSMPRGGVLKIISRKTEHTDPQDRSNQLVWGEIIFEDTGEGIEEEILDKIFLPFFTTREGGSGLGLAIVHRIIEEHGGKIDVRSKSGKGTRFTIHLLVD